MAPDKSGEIPHLEVSSIKHVSGQAYYTDDIVETPGTLYGAIGWSKRAHAIIKKINLKEVEKKRRGSFCNYIKRYTRSK